MTLGKKILWSGLGWAMGGPIGAILGYAFASFSDQQPKRRTSYSRTTISRTNTEDFMASLLILLASVMKADDKLLHSELDCVKRFLGKQFNKEDANHYIILFREIIKQTYSLPQVCQQIQSSMDHPSRLELIHLLFGLSSADGETHSKEIDIIQIIARYLNVNDNDFASIKAIFVKSTKSAYQILEIDLSDSNDEVKKAYRKMAKKYHPDKVAHLGEELRVIAEEKFKAVNKAYKDIKLERGM
ncbi:TerB family tellurite resistance protein [bacterium]|nr:TerB family tellurite resistance protein [bacterium]